MIQLPVPEKSMSRPEEAPREEKHSYPPREELSSYASSEELSVHIESLDKKRSIDQLPVPEKSLSRPEENPTEGKEIRQKDEEEEDPKEGSRSQKGSKHPNVREESPEVVPPGEESPGRDIKIPVKNPTWTGSPSQTISSTLV